MIRMRVRRLKRNQRVLTRPKNVCGRCVGFGGRYEDVNVVEPGRGLRGIVGWRWGCAGIGYSLGSTVGSDMVVDVVRCSFL
jgi:hypothetical protein